MTTQFTRREDWYTGTLQTPHANEVLLSLKMKRSQTNKTKQTLEDKTILPPVKNPPKHCPRGCVTSHSVMQGGGKTQKVKGVETKAGKGIATLHPDRLVIGFLIGCC